MIFLGFFKDWRRINSKRFHDKKIVFLASSVIMMWYTKIPLLDTGVETQLDPWDRSMYTSSFLN